METSVSARMPCFHHSRSSPETINTRDWGIFFCLRLQVEIGLYVCVYTHDLKVWKFAFGEDHNRALCGFREETSKTQNFNIYDINDVKKMKLGIKLSLKVILMFMNYK